MLRFRIKKKSQGKIILNFDSQHNKIQSNLQSNSANFYSSGPIGQCFKTFYARNLRVFVLS
jgi:hypothetical protein